MQYTFESQSLCIDRRRAQEQIFFMLNLKPAIFVCLITLALSSFPPCICSASLECSPVCMFSEREKLESPYVHYKIETYILSKYYIVYKMDHIFKVTNLNNSCACILEQLVSRVALCLLDIYVCT